jgi:hypothetical protein
MSKPCSEFFDDPVPCRSCGWLLFPSGKQKYQSDATLCDALAIWKWDASVKLGVLLQKSKGISVCWALCLRKRGTIADVMPFAYRTANKIEQIDFCKF